jgi:two-component system chemotaxis response regulator CheY
MAVDRAIAILIVDDFATVSRIIRSMLERSGFANIEHVHDGPSALERLKSRRFSLVISDWNMAPMNGLELLQRIRQDADSKALRFILITAGGSPQIPAVVQNLGVDGLLVKPFSAEILTNAIEQAFAQKK